MASREAGPSLSEEAFVIEALRDGVRMDGRGLVEARELVLTPLTDAMECCLGETRVVAQVTAEVVRPRPDRPFEGTLDLVWNEITPMASFAYEYGRSSDEEILISRLLEKAVRRSRAVDLEALCIVAGKQVWAVRVDVHFLNDEGNLLDCASIACIAALRHFRRPDVSVVGNDVTIHPLDDREPVPLSLHHSPYCTTFTFLGSSPPYYAVLDPSLLEHRLSSGSLTVAVNPQREVCIFNKAGGAPMSPDEMMRLVSVATKRAIFVEGVVKGVVDEAQSRRKLESAMQNR